MKQLLNITWPIKDYLRCIHFFSKGKKCKKKRQNYLFLPYVVNKLTWQKQSNTPIKVLCIA